MAKRIKIIGMKRHNLYEQFEKKGFKTGAEIGVYKGTNAFDMLNTISNLTLYGIDNWKTKGGRTKAKRRLNYYIEKKRFILITANSIDASHQFKDESLDFVYIDADHSFDAVIQDLIYWCPKVRRGGIVSGHDYYRDFKCGVITAVNAYASAHKIQVYITDAETKRRNRACNSFFWEKQ